MVVDTKQDFQEVLAVDVVMELEQTTTQVQQVAELQLLDKEIEVAVVTKQDNMLAVAVAEKVLSVLMVPLVVHQAVKAVLENKMILTEQITIGQVAEAAQQVSVVLLMLEMVDLEAAEVPAHNPLQTQAVAVVLL